MIRIHYSRVKKLLQEFIIFQTIYTFRKRKVVQLKDFESLQKQRNKKIEDGWAPEGTSAKSIIVHELGHALCGYFAKKHKMSLELFCEKIQDKVLTLTGLAINDVPKGLSKYATENSKEFCSEAFCEYFEIAPPDQSLRLLVK